MHAHLCVHTYVYVYVYLPIILRGRAGYEMMITNTYTYIDTYTYR